jgi:hypothetical protein
VWRPNLSDAEIGMTIDDDTERRLPAPYATRFAVSARRALKWSGWYDIVPLTL